MINKGFTIGVLGGMGTYATINLFQQYAEIFPAEKEWERPRIIIDNRCTMPSRVRAFLYEENVDKLISEMVDSIEHLINAGGNMVRILLACNTSHLFLPHIYQRIPYAEKYIVNIINMSAEYLCSLGCSQVRLLGTEATIDSGVYQNKLRSLGIDCISPNTDLYACIRACMEAVKTNRYNDEIKHVFLNLLSGKIPVLLGCTELPILYKKYENEVKDIAVFDPLRLGLEKIREDFLRCER